MDETIVELEASSASAALSRYTGSKLSETMKVKGNTFDAALSSCTSSKLSEIVNLNVDSETGSIELMGSGLDSIFCSRLSSVGVTTYTETGDPPCAAPSCYTCSKLSETVNLMVNTFASETGNFDLTGSRLEFISCLGKSFMNVAPVVSPADAQASERLYQLAEIIGASKTLPGTLGLWAVVVDADPCDACAMSEGLLATLIHDDDTECEEAAAPYDQDYLLERAMMTGWKRYEEGERDVDELVAAAVEAIEGDVTDHDMCVDLIQAIQAVFGQAVFPGPPPLSRGRPHVLKKPDALNVAKAESTGDTHSRETRQ